MHRNFKKNIGLKPPSNWIKIKTIDMHTGGEPLRVIVDGFPKLSGDSILDYRQDCMQNYDDLRKALMWEPRGHADMYGCLIVPPENSTSDFGVIFLHNDGYSTMCGHAIIAISKLAVLMNWIPYGEGENILEIDAPCGTIKSHVEVENNQVKSVYFHGVPSFVSNLNLTVDVPELGKIRYDLVYGGAFYAYIDMSQHDFNFNLSSRHYETLNRYGRMIKKSIIASGQKVEHPFNEALGFLYGVIFMDGIDRRNMKSTNVCVFANGEVDRSPTGSGVSGRLALHYAKNEMTEHDIIQVESIVGSIFKGSIVRLDKYGIYNAVIPKVEGTAFVTGEHAFYIDPSDPYKHGFLLR